MMMNIVTKFQITWIFPKGLIGRVAWEVNQFWVTPIKDSTALHSIRLHYTYLNHVPYPDLLPFLFERQAIRKGIKGHHNIDMSFSSTLNLNGIFFLS